MDDQEELLVFIFSPEPKWGNYVVYPARVADKGDFYLYLGRYAEEKRQQLTSAEAQIVKLCRAYEVAELYAKFGKEKFRTDQVFASKVDDKTLKTVRAFVDKTVEKIVRLIMEAGLPLFLRENRWDNPFKENRIRMMHEPLKPLVGFYRNDENIRYTLRLSVGDEVIIPARADLKIITEQPALIWFDNRLYYLADNFSGIRLRPFLRKEEVVIPRQNEAAYFRTFILKNICNEDIEVEGFDVIEPEVEKRAFLSLEQNLLGEPILELKFRYNDRTVFPDRHKAFIVELKEDSGQYRFYKFARDFEWEKGYIAYLERLGLKYSSAAHFVWKQAMAWSDAVDWLVIYSENLKEHGIEVTQEKLNRNYYLGNYSLSYVRETSSADWFQLKAEILLENGYKFYLQDLWENILSGQREYRLENDTIFIIPEEWFARYSGLLLFGRKGKEGRITMCPGQETLLESTEKETLLPAVTAETEVTVPAALRATLRDYQLKGFRWLYSLYKQRRGSCLADDMGLGKTVQAIALLLKYKEETQRKNDCPNIGGEQLTLFEEPEEKKESSSPEFHTCLIVAPASVEYNWRNELQKFAPSLTVGSYIGLRRSRMQQALMRWDVVTTTYQTMRNDIGFFSGRHFGIVVFDEAQMFKNRDSLLFKAVGALQAEHFVALSGTPIENSLSDLWSLMNIINPGLLGSYAVFQKYFIRPIDLGLNKLHITQLNRLVKPYILRRTKEEVLSDLPERTDELILCEPTPEQKRVYEEELSKARNQILERALGQSGSNTIFNALQAIVRLRQIANHPRLIDEAYEGSSGKVQEVFRMLETVEDSGHKVLLFSDYVKYLDLIGKEMERRGWSYARLVGATKDREKQISRFNTDKDCRFFLISLKAGGVGINLTEADYVFILDPWWNTAAEEQAIGRAHRMGQKQAVFVYRFVSSGTLEEKILEIQRKKAHLSKAVISVDNERLPFTTDELEHLITDE